MANTTRSSDATTIGDVKDLYRYIWKTSARRQVILSILAVAVFLLELAPLELQRRIVNGAVAHRDFHFIGLLCLVYVAVALLYGGLKFGLNVLRSSVGEAANQRLRLQVDPAGTDETRRPAVAAEAKTPPRVAPAENGTAERGIKISIIVSEVEAVGGFVGSSICDPVLNAGILLSVFGYMLLMQPWLALIALMIFAPQLLFVPFLQKAINVRTKQRIESLREVSVDIANEETDASGKSVRKAFAQRVKEVYRLNMGIFYRKFGMIFLMNLLYTLGVISILGVGAWLLLQGKTEVGTIVAFISGLGLMNDPWRDLVNYFRDLTNAGLKYRLISAELSPPSAGPRVSA